MIANLINRHPSILLAIVVIAFGIAGSMDYADAKLQEKISCEKRPKPEFCRGVE